MKGFCMKYPLRKYFGAVVLAVFLSIPASWGQVTEVFGPYTMSVTHSGYGLNINETGSQQMDGEFLGQFQLTFENNPQNKPPGYETISSFTTYCVEIDVYITPAPSIPGFYVQSFNQSPNLNWLTDGPQKAAYLYNTYRGVADNTSLSPQERNVAAAALQAAIWTSLYGEAVFGVDPGTGNQGLVYQLWADYLNDFNDPGWRNQSYDSSWWKTSEKQGFIGTPIPEPDKTGLGMVLLLVGIAGLELRRRKKNSAG
jgi:hypothetical protein